jgi:hypothetical protein
MDPVLFRKEKHMLKKALVQALKEYYFMIKFLSLQLFTFTT